MNRYLYFILLVLSITSCDYFVKEADTNAVVTVGKHILTASDINEQLPSDYTVEDSIAIISRYVDNWATEKLMYDQALLNIEEDRQEQLDQLVNTYKTELFTQEYLTKVIKQNLDTIINKELIAEYYEDKSEQFLLNEDVIQYLYVYVDNNYPDINKLRALIGNAGEKEINQLDSLKLGFKRFYFNDTTWVKKSEVYDKVKAINPNNEKWYIKEGSSFKLEDSLGVYLVKFKKIKKKGEEAPLEYIAPVIKQILLNRSKVQYVKRLEKDILNDAKQSNEIKIYK